MKNISKKSMQQTVRDFKSCIPLIKSFRENFVELVHLILLKEITVLEKKKAIAFTTFNFLYIRHL